MTTLKAIRRHLYELQRDLVGRQEAIASLTTTTAVVTALATGGYGNERFRGDWLLRADAASSADRVRKVTSFTSSTGTLTHAGTNYSDTTATSEVLEILRQDYEPADVDNAIQYVLGTTRRRDRYILPGVSGQSRYYLHNLTWLDNPNRVMSIALCTSPVLTNNRYFEKWNSVSTAGVPVPDNWTLAGSGATMARSTTGARKGQYSVALTRATNNVTLTQDATILSNGSSATPSSLRGQIVTAVIVGTASSASQLRVTLDDGVTTTSSSYHTGGGGIEELSAEHTMSSTATQCVVSVEVNGSDGTVYVDEAYICFRTLTDTVRRDEYPEQELKPRDTGFDQGNGTLTAVLPPISWGQQYVVYSQRPYPQFDSTRFLAGNADADVTDAPKDLIATGAMWRIHEALVGKMPDAEKWAGEYRQRYEQLAASHLYKPSDHDGAVNLPIAMIGGRPAGRG